MCRGQPDLRRLACIKRLLPTRRAKAPTIAGLEPGKAEGRHRRREVVAGGLGKGEEFGIHAHADRVHAKILGSRLTAAGSVKAGHWPGAAFVERLAENIAWPGAAAGIGTGSIGHRWAPPQPGRCLARAA